VIRAVLDTNTLVSGIGWSGPPQAILNAAIQEKFLLLLSTALLDELRRVLAYPRLKALPQTHVREVLALLPLLAIMVEPEERITVVRRDPSDNRVLECAVAGEATHIVTGDKDLLDLKSFRDTSIMTPAVFLRILRRRRD
jgi:putative PIN family toxin of toxin-antitoxin system